jgi:hypothetical protein
MQLLLPAFSGVLSDGLTEVFDKKGKKGVKPVKDVLARSATQG